MTTRLVGILNLTPDSFSDGGKAGNPQQAAAQLEQLLKDGAHIVDVGAESTRPGATPLTADEEWQRLSPFLSYLKQHHPDFLSHISIDTRHAPTAEKALGFGVAWINDVSGFESAAMVNAVKHARCDIVVMHSLSVPADPDVTLASAADPIAELKKWATARIQTLGGQGIEAERIIFDPGIGFGKTALQSQAIIERIGELKSLGMRLLVGHSRKSFLSLDADTPLEKRDEATAHVSMQLAKAGVDYLRVHNVRANTGAVRA